MLEIKSLYKSYDSKEVLHGLDLEVKKGEIFGFIGPNGAGKSTTIKCITGISSFEKGEIKVNGYDVKKESLKAKRHIAYLPDNPDLYENLTGQQFLNFVADVFGMDTVTRAKEIESLAKEWEIYDVLGDSISSYSHGMKQKLALVSAFMHKPDLLVLDEPFVGLDPKASFILKEKMRNLCDNGSAVLFSSHVLEVVEKLCDKVAIIVDGNIQTMGNTADIIADSSLEDIFLELDK